MDKKHSSDSDQRRKEFEDMMTEMAGGEFMSVEKYTPKSTWKRIPDVAMYKKASWSSEVMRVEGVNLDLAFEIAESLPSITFFFIVKGERMILETLPEDQGVFQHGDAVFFSGKPWYGSAPGLADSYEKCWLNQLIDSDKLQGVIR